MTIIDVADEALAYCENLSAEDKGNMLAIVSLPKDRVRTLLSAALATNDAQRIEFMQVAWFLHAVVNALAELERSK